MIKHPVLLILILLAVETAVLFISRHPRTQRFFSFLPGVFWIYFLPMLLSTAGIIDSQNPVYQKITTHLLPMSLFLLLIAVDIRAILRLGGPALVMFFAGSAGIMLGTPLAFLMFKDLVGPQFWSGFGALSGSWTGGSANMIAVKESIGTPDSVFTPMVIVDTVVPYVWMGTLIACAGLQKWYDRWNRSDRRILDDLSARVDPAAEGAGGKLSFANVLLLVMIGIAGAWLAGQAARYLPVIKDVISTYAWTIILVTALGVGGSLTRARRLEQKGSTRVGYFILYFVLTVIGAKASIASAGSAVLLILAGTVIVLVHAVVILTVGRLMKAPLFLIAAASQANIGGVASAPVVAEIYQPGFASVGLLLAILGNIAGTYIGIITAQVCRAAAGL